MCFGQTVSVLAENTVTNVPTQACRKCRGANHERASGVFGQRDGKCPDPNRRAEFPMGEQLGFVPDWFEATRIMVGSDHTKFIA